MKIRHAVALVSTLAALLHASTPACALVKRPLSSLVREADVIVVGTCGGSSTSARDPMWNGTTIDVVEVLHPRGLDAERLDVEWKRGNPAVDTLLTEGAEGIWLLSSTRYGRYRAGVQCLVPPDRAEHVRMFVDLDVTVRTLDTRDGRILKITLNNLSERQQEFPGIKIVSRAFDRGHAMELIELGVAAFTRETFHSAVEMGKDVLVELGYDRVEATHLATIMRDHDIDTMHQQAAVRHDEKKVISIAHSAQENLEQTLAADRNDSVSEDL